LFRLPSSGNASKYRCIPPSNWKTFCIPLLRINADARSHRTPAVQYINTFFPVIKIMNSFPEFSILSHTFKFISIIVNPIRKFCRSSHLRIQYFIRLLWGYDDFARFIDRRRCKFTDYWFIVVTYINYNSIRFCKFSMKFFWG
jgi:hypothetical protein